MSDEASEAVGVSELRKYAGDILLLLALRGFQIRAEDVFARMEGPDQPVVVETTWKELPSCPK